MNQIDLTSEAQLKKQLLLSETGNRRIIDQLNGQVDFLNEQLALRETEIREGMRVIIIIIIIVINIYNFTFIWHFISLLVYEYIILIH